MRRLALLVLGGILMTGCGPEPSASFRSVNNETGTFDSDFTGDGGSTSQSFTWTNTSTQADYSMDITSANEGRVTVVLRDADGTEVASFTLDSASPDDTLDGTSSVGTAGDWTIEVTVRDFAGDGSLHIGSDTGT